MFSPLTFTNRRQQLKQKVGKGLIVLLGNDDSSMSYKGNVYPFRQDSTFLYYTGIDKPSFVLLIDIDNDKEILFGNEATDDDIIWTGPQESLQAIATKAGITRIQPFHKIEPTLQIALQQHEFIHFLPPYRAEHSIKLFDWLNVHPSQAKDFASVELIKAIVAARSIKSTEEILEIEKAVDLTVDMQLANIRFAQAGMTESAIAGKLYDIAIGGGGSIAFPIILTVNGETLHNHYRNVKVESGQMILCDCGAETAMHYGGDLTRTIAVDKKFTTKQADVYNIVLAAQKAAISAAIPGVLFKDVHAIASKKLLEGLSQIGLVKGNLADAFTNDVHTLFFQCGLGHMLGLDTHDMENLGEEYVGYTENLKKTMSFGWKSLRLGRALEPGFVVTVEPGLYFIPQLIDQWKAGHKCTEFVDYDKLEGFKNFGGIRIEDDIVITENSNRILGKALGKEIEDLY